MDFNDFEVGTVDGQRLWGKELKQSSNGLQLSLVEWSAQPEPKQ